MRSGKWMLPSLAGLALSVIAAQATTYSFDSVNIPTFVGPGGSIGGTWDLTSQGYSSSAEELVSAEAYFTVMDLDYPGGGGSQSVTITLDGVPFVSGGSISLNLLSDGSVSWLISETSGISGLVVSDATLTVQTRPRSIGVFDGGSTLALLGGASLMVGLVFRRRSENQS